MKTISAGLLSLLLLGAAVGCATPQSARIREHRALFDALQPRVKEQIRSGIVKVGFTSDMVYLALGKPSSVTRWGASDQRETWIYDRYVANPFVRVEYPSGDQSQEDSQLSVVADLRQLHVVIRSGRVIAVNLSD